MNEDDEKFLQSFEQCSLSGKCLTHAAHIRMAWLQMERSDSFAEALGRIRSGLMLFNSSVKTVAYHETITVAFARLIDSRRAAEKHKHWQDFLDKNSDLLAKDCLNAFYSPEILSSPEAIVSFIEPDRAPLPLNSKSPCPSK